MTTITKENLVEITRIVWEHLHIPKLIWVITEAVWSNTSLKVNERKLHTSSSVRLEQSCIRHNYLCLWDGTDMLVKSIICGSEKMRYNIYPNLLHFTRLSTITLKHNNHNIKIIHRTNRHRPPPFFLICKTHIRKCVFYAVLISVI